MKKLLVGAALGLGLLAGPGMASAVEFNAQGEWLFGFGAVESSFMKNNNNDQDVFNAQQRIRLYLDATVSENLSGTVGFTIGDVRWGQNGGGQLGTDGPAIGVRDAYIDWMIPDSKLMFRMGLQGVATPNAAGGSAVIDDQVAGIVASYQATENVGVTAFWIRPANDNYTQAAVVLGQKTNDVNNYLDNVDYFGISVPIVSGGIEVTPWAMIGFAGKNATGGLAYADGWDPSQNWANNTGGFIGDPSVPNARPSEAYGMQYYFGLPIVFGGFAPFNIELDLNYGYSESAGKFTVMQRTDAAAWRRADSKREGWLIKALFEYQMEWGTPGLIAWYASGDDGNIRNGSERMPSISPSSNFTSFMQDGDTGWTVGAGFDLMLEYGGTWAIGLQLKDLSFMEDLSHNLRVVYWGGTNSTGMIKNMAETGWTNNGFYLTTSDYLVEINVDSSYAIYENLTAIVELGYIINGIDRSKWRDVGAGVPGGFDQKEDAWKAALVMKYEF